MVLSSLFFLDLKGKILISRDYRADISPRHAEEFIDLLAEREIAMELAENSDLPGSNSTGNSVSSVQPPIFHKNGISYCYIKHNNLYLLAMTRRNSNVFAILQFLHRLIQVFKEYFYELEEESLRDNFVIIYELLDEMMDFGYPQLTETKILKEYITQQSFKLEKSSKTQLSAADQLASKASQAGTSVVSWRPEGIKYRKNEVFLDVIESVNLTVNSQGQVVKNEVMGSVKIRCYLSGMPELKLGLNDKVLFDVRGSRDVSALGSPGSLSGNRSSAIESNSKHSSSQSNAKSVELEHVKFHQCVKLSRFEQDRTISFIPPDGEFELLSYRVSPMEGTAESKPLLWTECKIDKFTQSTLEFSVNVKSQYKRRSAANNVTILIPVPKDSDTPRLKASIGSAFYAPELDAISWTIGFFPGGKEFALKIKVGLPSVTSTNQVEASTLSRPINLSFEIPYFTTSGIQVRYLKIIEKSGYPALPWVRYITRQGNYEFRMPENK